MRMCVLSGDVGMMDPLLNPLPQGRGDAVIHVLVVVLAHIHRRGSRRRSSCRRRCAGGGAVARVGQDFGEGEGSG